MNIAFFYLALVVFAVAIWYDVCKFRIPNWLTFGAAVAALVVSFLIGGKSLLVEHFLGALVVGGVWLLFWKNGVMGGGDQKLMMASGALVGLGPSLTLLILVALAGGLQSLCAIFYKKYWSRSEIVQKSWKKIPLPYSIAIGIGTFGTIFMAMFGKLIDLR